MYRYQVSHTQQQSDGWRGVGYGGVASRLPETCGSILSLTHVCFPYATRGFFVVGLCISCFQVSHTCMICVMMMWYHLNEKVRPVDVWFMHEMRLFVAAVLKLDASESSSQTFEITVGTPFAQASDCFVDSDFNLFVADT